jgi:hypothetical protein
VYGPGLYAAPYFIFQQPAWPPGRTGATSFITINCAGPTVNHREEKYGDSGQVLKHRIEFTRFFRPQRLLQFLCPRTVRALLRLLNTKGRFFEPNKKLGKHAIEMF